ncbi:exported protein of unknown function [uncultured Woeseiaceae bacterium]|uniref:Creatininase family protein n=1 Tax=uncultured Woeseiaceae bacterium TaxID=1983305 RepID=A0A7D9D367_9GAMM|nr:exported protein of unknown function [uncultured Woeseiaceae bacterium]
MSRLITLALVLCAIPFYATAQILEVAELSARDIERLDRDQTVVIIRGGLFEQHGPYLPSFTDGYLNAWLADRTAEAILAERGGTVLMFPMIPLGSGVPEDFGGLSPYSGSYTVRPETLRAVFMDLASALGEDGFRTIFVFHRHGAPSHNRALLEAAEYFNDRFDGAMVVLTSLLYEGTASQPKVLDADAQTENGFGVHADANETSQTLFLVPHLVHEDYQMAPPFSADTGDGLSAVAKRSGWPGYLGSPRLGDAKAGAQLVKYRAENAIELALRIMDGFDWRSLPTRAELDQAFLKKLDDNHRARSDAERRIQEAWISDTGKR